MNVSDTRPQPGGFEDRLEAELVKVVIARAALPPVHRQIQRHIQRRAPTRRPSQRLAAATRRPVVRASVLAAGTAVAAAAGFAFGGPSLSHRQAAPPQAELGTGAGPVHIRTAAFTVDTNTDGTVRLAIDKSHYISYGRDIAGLQQALREAGVPVLIKEGVFCKGPRDSGYLGPGGVGPGVGPVMQGQDQPGVGVVFIFTPGAIPAGEELFIGYLSPSQLAITHGRPGSVERLVPAGGPLTCTTQVPA